MADPVELDPGFWDRIAESYAAKPVADPAAFQRKIDETRARMAPGCTVLDVGCGTGSLALILAPDAGQVHGMDLSEEMIRIARGKAEAQGISNVTFHVGTLEESTAFGPGSLDVLCAYSLLHLLPDRARFLKRAMTLLKPGGAFISSSGCLGDSWIPFSPILKVMRWLGKAPYVSIFTRAALEEEIRAAGFVDLTGPDVGAKPTVAFLIAQKP